MKALTLCLTFLVSGNVFAQCGEVPQSPLLLNAPQLNVAQLEDLETQLESYYQSIDAYQTCIDGKVVSLDPELDNYQTVFEDLMRLMDMTEEQKLITINRFNMHVETVDVNLVEEPQ